MHVLAPFLLPLITALLTTFLQGRSRAAVNLLGAALLFISAILLLMEVGVHGRLSVALGAWQLPYGVELSADGLSAIMVLLVAVVNLAILVYQSGWRESSNHSGLYPLQHSLVAATMATLLAADLFNLYVWLELVLIATLGLLALGGKTQHHEAAFKYFSLSMVGTLAMLAAIGLIYGATGHLNLQELARVSRQPEMLDVLPMFAGLLLVSLLLKAGAFPLFAWLPAAYHTLPAPVLALVGGLLTKVTVYVLLRMTGQVFDISRLYEALGWIAIITMLSGVLGAAYHWDLRRILAFHIISQVGYLLLGLAMASEAAVTATSFFLFHNILVKTNLFLIAGLMWFSMGHHDLRKGGGLFTAHPLLAVLFLLSALSLVGVPPTSGFWGKFLILDEALNQKFYFWAAVALVTGLLTLYSMSKIWMEGFWKPHPEPSTLVRLPLPAYGAVVTLSLVILLIGIYPEPIIMYLNQYSSTFHGAMQ